MWPIYKELIHNCKVYGNEYEKKNKLKKIIQLQHLGAFKSSLVQIKVDSSKVNLNNKHFHLPADDVNLQKNKNTTYKWFHSLLLSSHEDHWTFVVYWIL